LLTEDRVGSGGKNEWVGVVSSRVDVDGADGGLVVVLLAADGEESGESDDGDHEDADENSNENCIVAAAAAAAGLDDGGGGSGGVSVGGGLNLTDNTDIKEVWLGSCSFRGQRALQGTLARLNLLLKGISEL